MLCVQCNKPIPTPTEDPFRCPDCRVELDPRDITIINDYARKEAIRHARNAAALEIRLQEEQKACEWVRAELRGARQRIADLLVTDGIKTREINLLTAENRALGGFQNPNRWSLVSLLQELWAALNALVDRTEACDNQHDQGVGSTDPVVIAAKAVLEKTRQ